MSYSVQIRGSAAKELAGIEYDDRLRIAGGIDALGEGPFMGLQMKGDLRGLRRLRVGTYRIIYEVLEDALVLLAVRIRHRREVYRRG